MTKVEPTEAQREKAGQLALAVQHPDSTMRYMSPDDATKLIAQALAESFAEGYQQGAAAERESIAKWHEQERYRLLDAPMRFESTFHHADAHERSAAAIRAGRT